MRYCQCHLSRNPDESIHDLLDRVDAQIARLSVRGKKKRRRNPPKRWSRPMSAGLARLSMGEPLEEDEPQVAQTPSRIPGHQILVVGGDASYIPDWMRRFSILQIAQVDVDLERELGAFRPELILVFVKAPAPFRPSKHTIYKVHNYARGDNSERREVPRITIHKGWGHVIQRAQELGVDWFTANYPFPVYVPEEDLEPRTRKRAKPGSPVNIRRAMQFTSQGITAGDVAYAKTRYVLEEPSHCVLCNTKIKYQFRLMFDRPDQPEPIVFFPVGSVCIMDWVEALPDTPKKLALLNELKSELERAEAAQEPKKKKAAEDRKAKKKQIREGIKAREADRKRKLAEKKKTKGSRASEHVEPPAPLPPRKRSRAETHGEEELRPDELDDSDLRSKFDAAQQEFDWD